MIPPGAFSPSRPKGREELRRVADILERAQENLARYGQGSGRPDYLAKGKGLRQVWCTVSAAKAAET